jgi:pyocin large subunit-like protein
MIPRWVNRRALERHFTDHGADVGAGTVAEYEASTAETIRVEKRFTYVDRSAGKPHVGYFDPATGKFTGLDRRGHLVYTHFVPSDGEDYVRRLRQSDYDRA